MIVRNSILRARLLDIIFDEKIYRNIEQVNMGWRTGEGITNR